MSQPDPFFRGTELPRLLVLLAIMAGGMVVLWQFALGPGLGTEPEPAATVPLTPIVPDHAPEFETVVDKTPIQLRDMAAYRLLLERARGTAPAELARQARRDVLSYQIWERPKRYRGVPIHLLGTVLRVLTYESKLAAKGRLYEAWMVTSDSDRNPYVCVFEDAPGGFPVGDRLSERVVFDGYFLKLMRYDAANTPRASPLLVGRIGWRPEPSRNPSRDLSVWLAGAVGLMFVVSFFRWMAGLRRSLSLRSRPAPGLARPTDQIDPEALSAWAESMAEDEADEKPEGT